MESVSRRHARATKLKTLAFAALIGLLSLAVVSVTQDASAATAPEGGTTSGGGLNLTETARKPQLAPHLGARVLREGMTGPDVKVLKGIVRSKSLLEGSGVTQRFDSPTTSAVRRFQRKTRIASNGIVNRNTARRLIGSMSSSGASWYGPGFYGNRTACGQILRPATQGVAHRTLPCGSKVLIGFRGRFVITTVIDRGPFISGRSWDLTGAVAKSLRFESVGVGNVRHAVLSRR
jgi:peptidoglycan hydrolase-like protein with peptidoglycan-binding domain